MGGPLPFPVADVPALFASNTYSNIHDSVFPGGEIRGQLLLIEPPPPTPDSGSTAAMLGFALVAAALGLSCAGFGFGAGACEGEGATVFF